MNQNSKLTAKDIVNNYSLDELCRVFREYGEEKYSYSIAKNIIKAREKKEIEREMAALEPQFCEFLALSLEEVFISEMEVAGYDINSFKS